MAVRNPLVLVSGAVREIPSGDAFPPGAGGMVTPMMYGAAGDGTTDDSTPVQSALNSGRAVLIDRTYLVGGLTLATGNTVFGARGGKLLRKSASTYTMSINSGSGGSSDPSTNIARVSIIGVTFDDDIATNGFRQGDAQLNLNACSDVLILGCTFLAFRGDAIYLGSSNVAATERHNQRVKILDNLFDGVTKGNRNGISVIDCYDLLIAGNTFRRCTKSDMPGAIDIEPNSSNTFAILRDFRIVNNSFDDIGGSCCIGTFMASVATYTAVPSGWLIAGNAFRNLGSTVAPINLLFQGDASSSTGRQGIVIRDNVTTSTYRLAVLDGVRGVQIAGNTVAGTTLAGVIIGSGYRCFDVTINDNEFFQCGSADSGNPCAINVVNVTSLKMDRNSFIDCGLSDNSWGNAVVFGGSGATSDYVYFVNNTMVNVTRTTDTIYKSSGHTIGSNRTSYGTIGELGLNDLGTTPFKVGTPTATGHAVRNDDTRLIAAASGGGRWEYNVYQDLLANGHRDDATSTWAFSGTNRTLVLLLGLAPAGSYSGFRVFKTTAAVSGAGSAALYQASTRTATSWARLGAGNVTPTLTGTGQLDTALSFTLSGDAWVALVWTLTTAPSTYPVLAATPAGQAALLNPSSGAVVSGASSGTSTPGSTVNPTTGFTTQTQKPWASLY